MIGRLLFLSIVMTTFTIAQQSPHGQLSIPCEACHSADSWSMRTDAQFTHASTGFVLAGRHKYVACVSCHEKLVFTKKNSDCLSCHTDVHKSELGTNCLRCHTMESWVISDMKQKHQDTRFPLLGKHASVTCESCHNRSSSHQYGGTPLTCITCHRSEFQATTNPNHTAVGFPIECARCHKVTAATWSGSFDHNLTAFPLTGGHRAVICSECHANNQFTKRPTECFACHQNDFTRTTQPNHVSLGMPHDCLQCHRTEAWRPATFDHNTTNFALTGKHMTVQCQSCHTNGNYQITFSDCYQCHQTDYQRPSNPNHVALVMSHDCRQCHSTTSWSGATFDHSTTQFALTGKHTTVQCQSCHKNGDYQITFTDCYQCHQTDYQRPTDPNHVTIGMPHDCRQCHSTTSWFGATFDHSTTHFALTGKHTSTTCQSCHVNNNYQITFTDCYQCHQTDYQRPSSPNHVAANYNHDCRQCHSTTSWSGATFDHGGTNFALTGKHATATCLSCHVNGNYQITYSDCYQCHQTNFQGTTNPNHVTGNLGHDCTPCHTTTAWTPAAFNHSTTSFPLTGKHTTATCLSCHVNGNYQLAYTDCYQCHQTDFQRPTNPNHVSGNFGHDCKTCHSTTAWTPATFSHSATNFPLTGKHTTATCLSCHVSGNYQITFTDCYQCHQTDYQRPTNPNHATANFGHDCRPCHTTTAWTPSTFNHDTQYFRINSGAHRGKWSSCSNCHQNNSNYADFTCLSCHKHNQVDTDRIHSSKRNYIYASPSCFNCHKRV